MRNQCVWVVSVLLFVVGMTADSRAAVWVINADGTGDAPTIQAGVDLADFFDTVLLTDGIFSGSGNRDVVFRGKRITVTSQNGAGSTIIDCQGLGRAFNCVGADAFQTTISGLTIRNGFSAQRGGAIFCNDVGPTIRDNVFENNESGSDGGAIACFFEASPITGNQFLNNTAASQGGAIAMSGGASTSISGNVFIGNSADFGGALDFDSNNGPLENNIFYANVANVRGGALATFTSGGQITNNTLVGNEAPTGAALYFFDSGPTIENTIIAFSVGGPAVVCNTPFDPTFACCDFFGNVGGA